MKKSPRFAELDIWRGVAVVLMVIFHIGYLTHFLELAEVPFKTGLWKATARTVQWSFMLLVGVGLQLSYQRAKAKGKSLKAYFCRQLKRGSIVFGLGLMITLTTYLIVPGHFVRFGILHLLGASIILLSPLSLMSLAAVPLAALIYVISLPISQIEVSHEIWFGIGFELDHYYYAMDHFPLFPWLAVPALGVFLACLLFRNYQRVYPEPSKINRSSLGKVLQELGKRSLPIYLIHFPAIAVLLLLLKKVLL